MNCCEATEDSSPSLRQGCGSLAQNDNAGVIIMPGCHSERSEESLAACGY